MNTRAAWQPANPAERYLHIDIIRGLALFGVLMVNLETVFRIPLLENILKHNISTGGAADQVVKFLVETLLEFKAVTIFSFLFGVGIAIQAERAESRSISCRRFLARRLAWLFVLGAVHMLLIWNGDILALYAICGLFAIPSLRLRWPVFLGIGLAALLLQQFIPFGIPLPTGQAANDLIERAHAIYGHGNFLSILKFRWHETWVLMVPLLIGILPRTVGLIYLGLAAWRSGILREPEKQRGKLWIALLCGAIGGPVLQSPLLLALAYVSALLLWLCPSRARSWPGLAALGRMALTNYVLQSVILGLVFYGYGFGLFGRIGPATAACVGVALYALQLWLSRVWLDRFPFGPFEWLWRTLSYGRFVHGRPQET